MADAAGEAAAVATRRRRISPLTLRILAVNLLAIGLLAAGLLYLGQYRRTLIASELSLLHSQGRLLAMALGEGAVASGDAGPQLLPDVASRLVRRLAEPAAARMRLFAFDGTFVADSRRLVGPGGLIEIEELPEPGPPGRFRRLVNEVYDAVAGWLPRWADRELYRESAIPHAGDYPEVEQALGGRPAEAVRRTPAGELVLTVAEPVQHYKRVVGALLLSTRGSGIEAAVRAVRLSILAVFAAVLAITVLLSVYLAGTIARPIRRLADAAEHVRRGQGRRVQIPDLSGRVDEIGELSAALRAMTAALWQRMDAIERFAADVAHEIKNPLTSLRSAVETAARVKDPAQQQRLMAIIVDDVRRLDRLISDISDASRLDAELSRAESEPVDIGRMLQTIVDIHQVAAGSGDAGEPGPPTVRLDLAGADLIVPGMEDRLVQVFRNLLSNAVSFSPPGGQITIHARRAGARIVVAVEDEGPGIPHGKEEAIFERFYTDRPAGEAFGTHSGLGLSISRQIVAAHGGRIWAENRLGPDGETLGARFAVALPSQARRGE